MYRNLTGASSALALLALLTGGAPDVAIAHEDNRLCNVIVDGDGEPVLESDSDNIAHSNSGDCPDGDGVAATESVEEEQETAAVVAAPVVAADPLNVYFDVGQDALDAGARAEVDAYAAEVMATSPDTLSVVGYTDTSGPADLNARLSEARANSVAAALMEAGVPPGLISRGASGEEVLAVETPDGTREANNRRVTVIPAY